MQGHYPGTQGLSHPLLAMFPSADAQSTAQSAQTYQTHPSEGDPSALRYRFIFRCAKVSSPPPNLCGARGEELAPPAGAVAISAKLSWGKITCSGRGHRLMDRWDWSKLGLDGPGALFHPKMFSGSVALEDLWQMELHIPVEHLT